jgi:hypothetical protein
MAPPLQTIPLSVPKSMLMDGTMFYIWEVQILNMFGDNRTKSDPSITMNIQHVHLLNIKTKNIQHVFFVEQKNM